MLRCCSHSELSLPLLRLECCSSLVEGCLLASASGLMRWYSYRGVTLLGLLLRKGESEGSEQLLLLERRLLCL